MNKLDNETRVRIINCLVEGVGINATCRMTGAAKNTVLKLLAEVGSATKFGHSSTPNRRTYQKKFAGNSALATCGRGRQSTLIPN
jgi:hypothetical protein